MGPDNWHAEIVSCKSVFIPFFLIILIIFFLPAGCATIPYDQATSEWKSHEDVARWLSMNFTYDRDRSRKISRRLKKQGPSGLLIKKPEKLYKLKRGYCADAAHFAITNLNRINPNYNARWVFIYNSSGRPHHWVAAFDYQNKLYIMDYGTGHKFRAMRGTHGPYSSLEDYSSYLSSLNIVGFSVGSVYYRPMPGTED
jgi:hypothetical protein